MIQVKWKMVVLTLFVVIFYFPKEIKLVEQRYKKKHLFRNNEKRKLIGSTWFWFEYIIK